MLVYKLETSITLFSAYPSSLLIVFDAISLLGQVTYALTDHNIGPSKKFHAELVLGFYIV